MKRLSVAKLSIAFPTRHGTGEAVTEVSFDVGDGEILGIVGESGAGKSTIGNAIMNLLPPPGRITNGDVIFEGRNLRELDADQMRKLRGSKIGMIFQDPQTALNPLMKIGDQLVESIRNARPMSEAAARGLAIDLLNDVGIPHAEDRLSAFPHELSGGMRQRVVIALAICGEPDLVIADEPTTALDVSIQSQILDLIKDLCRTRNLSVILITHDFGAIAQIADRVAVMYRGEIVETGKTEQVLHAPIHDYTKSLIAAVPKADRKLDRFEVVGDNTSHQVSSNWLSAETENTNVPAIEVKNLCLSFVLKKAMRKKNRKMLAAVDDVSFTVQQGETFGLVGESGSGKSTVARLVSGLYAPDAGDVRVLGQSPSSRGNRKLQMIFQDPYSSLNGHMRVSDIIAEPIRFYKLARSETEVRESVQDLLSCVGMPDDAARKYPHEFSGGQRQRISIARALAAKPRILVCDEPTSALDVSIQAQILNLLKDLQDAFSLTMLFISHDLPVIRQMCDNVAVMRHGRLLETAPTEELFDTPKDEYSKHLIGLIPSI